ncbi:hypothetical protein I5Q34_18835 [Streptomyces sp. AV19]|uniref:AMIN-like domain-containing (lipo)protein n=1 Tax=Streptomyces sp. AV19 TaxID=2793068 RepID=UPI0018FEC99F|nr:hypothetical protein [Streptomyces sp. AV19]MBH1936306.1 hypothetical protein [Streptomyces sp. AV19]MDG4532343.1 hypothetical protein [Streptomyces sp. AV19]
MRRLTTTVAALVMLTGAGTATAVAAPVPVPASADCASGWGSTDKSAEGADCKPLKNIRTGAHECYDRVVFDLGGAPSRLGYHVGYVDKFHQDGSGDEIPVGGGAILQVYLSAPSYDPSTGRATYAGKAGKPLPGVDIGGYRTFKDTKFGASFEGQTQVAVGVRAKLPFRVQHSGDKLIVDVAHTW